MAVWAILLAAGRGTRMQGAIADKVLTRLGGRTVLSYSLQAMGQAGCFEGIVLVYRDSPQMLRLVAAASVVPDLPTLGWAQGGGRTGGFGRECVGGDTQERYGGGFA